VLERTGEDQCGGTLTKAAAGPALPPNLSRLTRDAGRAAARPNAGTDRRVNALMSKRTSAPPQALSLKETVLGRCALTTSGLAAARPPRGRTSGHTERQTHLTVDVASATTEPQPVRARPAGAPHSRRHQIPPGGRADSYNPVLERAAKLGAAARLTTPADHQLLD